jgi:cell division protein ZapA
MQEYILNAFDLVNVSFRTEAGNDRVHKAHEYAQSLYEELKVHGGNLTRDRLLAILLLGITDDLLQQKGKLEDLNNSLLSLLKKIDDCIPDNPK